MTEGAEQLIADGEETHEHADEGSEGIGIKAFLMAVLLALAAGAVITLVVTALTEEGNPSDTSADAGFARDMTTHHAQAVEMAAIVYARTEDPDIRFLAYDILTTQQAQIGNFGAWLDMWGLSPTSLELPMTWMGHGMSGLMPGMATDEQVKALETLPIQEMDREFLRLMIEHHRGGVDMAIAGANLAGERRVRDLARLIAEAQDSEIEAMERMLSERGG